MPFCAKLPELVGVVAQLVERLVRNEEVRGSTPLGSTTFIFITSFCYPLFASWALNCLRNGA
jgi:hypothetical protein